MIMRHNHKIYIGSPCKTVFDFLLIGKTKKAHRSPKSEKPLYFLPKNRKPDAKKTGKTGNRNGQQNRKSDLKNGQNRKAENPNAPLGIV